MARHLSGKGDVRRKVVVAGGALLAVGSLFAAVVWIEHRPDSDRSMQDDAGSCASTLVLGGRTYYGVSVPGSTVIPQVPGPLATAAEGCGDDTDTELPVYAIAGIDPRVAVTRLDNTSIYVPAGRCDGFRGWDGLFGCLKRRLALGRRQYTAVRLVRPPATAGVGGIGIVTVPGRAQRRVRVLSLDGVEPSDAVALAADPRQVYVADGVCDRIGNVPFSECVGLR